MCRAFAVAVCSICFYCTYYRVCGINCILTKDPYSLALSHIERSKAKGHSPILSGTGWGYRIISTTQHCDPRGFRMTPPLRAKRFVQASTARLIFAAMMALVLLTSVIPLNVIGSVTGTMPDCCVNMAVTEACPMHYSAGQAVKGLPESHSSGNASSQTNDAAFQSLASPCPMDCCSKAVVTGRPRGSCDDLGMRSVARYLHPPALAKPAPSFYTFAFASDVSFRITTPRAPPLSFS